VELLKTIDNYRIHTAQGINDERIKETALYQNLEAEFVYFKNENQILKNRLDKLNFEYEELQAERRKYKEQIEVKYFPTFCN
jgi:hypothetical protein